MDNFSFTRFGLLTFVLFVVSFFAPNHIWAGDDRQDFASSVDVSVSKKFFKKLNVELTESFSLRDNSSELDKFYTKVDVSYNVIKGLLRIGADYYLISKANYKDDFYLNHRFSGYLRVKKDVARFSFGLKSKFQVTYRPEKEPKKQYKDFWRNKLYVSMKVPKIPLYPVAAAECFYRTNDYKGNNIEKMRYEAGAKYQFNKHNSVKALFRYDDGMNVVDPMDVYSVVLSYGFNL